MPSRRRGGTVSINGLPIPCCGEVHIGSLPAGTSLSISFRQKRRKCWWISFASSLRNDIRCSVSSSGRARRCAPVLTWSIVMRVRVLHGDVGPLSDQLGGEPMTPPSAWPRPGSRPNRRHTADFGSAPKNSPIRSADGIIGAGSAIGSLPVTINFTKSSANLLARV